MAKANKKENAVNRFHIDVRSDSFAVGDDEWMQILVGINLYLQRQWPHVEAHLEDIPTRRK